MKKHILNNRGFAVSVILYSSVTLVVLILFLIISILSTNLTNKKLIVDDIKKSVSGIIDKDTETLGNVTISSSDNKLSGDWHTGSFKLTFSMIEKDGVNYNFPIVYYYGTSSQSINNKIDGNELEITEDTTGTTYYVRACKTGNDVLCTNIAKYVVKTDKNIPKFTLTGDSTNWTSTKTLKLISDSISGIAYYEYYITDWEFEPTDLDITKKSIENNITITEPGKYIYT